MPPGSTATRLFAKIAFAGLALAAPGAMALSTKSLGTVMPVLAIAGALALRWPGGWRLSSPPGLTFLIASLGLLFAGLSLAWAPDRMQALESIGAATAILVAAPCARLLLSTWQGRLPRLMPALGLAMLALAILVVLAMNGAPRELIGLKAESFRMNRPSVVLAVLLFPALALLRLERRHVAMGALTLLAIIPLAYTDSQAALLAALGGTVALVFSSLAPRLALLALGGLGALAILAMPWLVDLIGLHMDAHVASALSSAHATERIEIWEAYRRIVPLFPVSGIGFEGSRQAAVVLAKALPGVDLRPWLLATHPHNAALQIWVEFGALGALLAAGFWLAAMRELARLGRDLLPWGIAVHGALFAVGMVSHGAWQPWWLALAVLATAWLKAADDANRARAAAGAPRRILYGATEDWFFASHFLPMARKARELGLEPVLAARAGTAAPRIATEGIRLVDVAQERRSRSLATVFATFRAYRRVIQAEQPAIIHWIALKPVLIGGLAAWSLGHRHVILAPTGLGATFVGGGSLSVRLIRAGLRIAIGFLARRPGWHMVFENDDDPKTLGIAIDARVTIVPGAGVAFHAFSPEPEPAAPPLRVAQVCRMVGIKGVADAVEGVRRARATGRDIVLDLWGEPDPSNPTAIPEETLKAWSAEPGIAWRGRANDVAAVWRVTHAALQLSHGGEGLPRAIVEAKAAGRPVIATDVPGCRQAVRDAIDGFIVPPSRPDAVAVALGRLFDDATLRWKMGRAARQDFEARLAEPHIVNAIAHIYARFTTQ